MRTIHLADGLRLRFPKRDDTFDEGVEIGIVAALMSLGQIEIRRRVFAGSLEPMASMADKLGYHVAEEAPDAEWVNVTFRIGKARPKLRLVHSTANIAPLGVAAG